MQIEPALGLLIAALLVGFEAAHHFVDCEYIGENGKMRPMDRGRPAGVAHERVADDQGQLEKNSVFRQRSFLSTARTRTKTAKCAP